MIKQNETISINKEYNTIHTRNVSLDIQQVKSQKAPPGTGTQHSFNSKNLYKMC